MEKEYAEISKESLETVLQALREREAALSNQSIHGLTEGIREAAKIDHKKTLKAWGEIEGLMLSSTTVIGIQKNVLYKAELKRMADIERDAVLNALAQFGGHRKKAADSLGMSERTIFRKIKDYDIEI